VRRRPRCALVVQRQHAVLDQHEGDAHAHEELGGLLVVQAGRQPLAHEPEDRAVLGRDRREHGLGLEARETVEQRVLTGDAHAGQEAVGHLVGQRRRRVDGGVQKREAAPRLADPERVDQRLAVPEAPVMQGQAGAAAAPPGFVSEGTRSGRHRFAAGAPHRLFSRTSGGQHSHCRSLRRAATPKGRG